jgi:hypothetical protein
MYSTGIGLVISGFHSLSRKAAVVPEEKTVKSHSTKTKGGFFEKLFAKGRSWFEEDV